MRAPHAQTMLRVRHSMRRSRPQAVQPRYVPEGRAGEATRGVAARGDAARAGSFMDTPDEGSAYAPPPEGARARITRRGRRIPLRSSR